MAKRPSLSQIALQEALLKSDSHAVAQFLNQNSRPLSQLLKNTRKIADYLLNGTDRQIQTAFDKVDAVLDRPERLPMGRLSLTKELRKPVIRAQLKQEFSALLHHTRIMNPFGIMANTWSSAMALIGRDENQRNYIASTLTGALTGTTAGIAFNAKAASTLAGVFMGYSAMTNDADAALPPAPEPTRHVLELDVTRFGPTELTITPRQQLNPLTSNFMQAKLGEIPFLSLGKDGNIRYRKWRVSEDVASAILNTARITETPAPLMFAMLGAESSFIADNLNEDTEACGLGQFIPSTLYEKVYNYAALVGYPHIQKLVYRHVVKRDEQKRPHYGFKPIHEVAAVQIQIACMDPEFNTRMNAVYITRNVGSMQERLKEFTPRGHQYYPVNFTEAYLAHFSGISRAIRMIEDMHENNGQSLAHMYFNRQATNANLNYLFVNGDKDKPRTVKQFMTFLKTEKGLGDGIMPDMRNWGSRKAAIEANMLALPIKTAGTSHPVNQLNSL